MTLVSRHTNLVVLCPSNYEVRREQTHWQTLTQSFMTLEPELLAYTYSYHSDVKISTADMF